jgi:8-oxo-dGTP pyrophosphatase MutT (NUDIX family)
MAHTERSAGVVVYRTNGSLPQRQYLLLDYGRHWDLPKGHLESGEDEMSAALRELKEETGIEDARFAPGFRHEISYHFRDRKRRLVHKTVAFFLASTDAETVTLSGEHVGWAFLDYEQALARLTYASAKRLLEAAHHHDSTST